MWVKSPSGSFVVRCAAGSVAGVLALTACGGSDDSTGDSTIAGAEPSDSVSALPTDSVTDSGSVPTGTGGAEQGIQQNGPIELSGQPLPPYEDSGSDPAVGTAAPVVEGQSFDGSPITIGGTTDNPTMVVFLAHWCPHCNDEIPVLVGLKDDGRIPEGLDVIGVSTAVEPDRPNYPPSEWIIDKDWPWPVMADDEQVDALAAFGGQSFPYTVVVGADGTVLARWSGEKTADDTVALLDEVIADT